MKTLLKWATSTVALLVAMTCAADDFVISPADRTQVGLTVYHDFGVVRDVRSVTLPTGIVSLDFQGIPGSIEPSSVRVTSIGKEDLFNVLRQTYRYDLLNKESLLRLYIGKKLKYSRTIQEGKKYERVLREGTLLALDPEIVKFGDEIEISPHGTISLPYIPEGLKTSPTLIWQIDNRVQDPQSIETSYITGGLTWNADYRLDLNDDETAGNLALWVSVKNTSGVDYPGAELDLVAGDVKRTQARGAPTYPHPAEAALMRMQSDEITGKPFFEYYMYSLPGSADLKNNQTTQFHLFTVDNVPVTKSYVLETDLVNRQLQQPVEDRFDVRLAFNNTVAAGLNRPLPKGTFRVFKEGQDGASQLLGEDELPHVSRGASAKVTVGKAFDLSATHTQTTFKRTGDRNLEMSYQVELRNRKKEQVTVTLDEKLFGDWKVTSQSERGKRLDASTQEYVVMLEPNASKMLTYTVQVDY